MNRIASQWLGRSLVVAGAALSVACSEEAPVGPNRGPALASQVAAPAQRNRLPDLEGCPELTLPVRSKLTLHAYAKGDQIYSWTGTSWNFVQPLATLYESANFRGKIGTHYAGPTWESNGGSTVIAAVLDRCTPDANDIPWLLLGSIATSETGVFRRVSYIHRVNTVGGDAPSQAGSFIGEMRRVPYTAEYYFYRSE